MTTPSQQDRDALAAVARSRGSLSCAYELEAGRMEGFGDVFATRLALESLAVQREAHEAREAELRAEVEMLRETTFIGVLSRKLADAHEDLCEMPMQIRRLQVEVERCHKRLEIDGVWQVLNEGEPAWISVLPEDRASVPDGIECRDDTIRLQDEQIKRLRSKRDSFRSLLTEAGEVLEPFATLVPETGQRKPGNNRIAHMNYEMRELTVGEIRAAAELYKKISDALS